MNPQKTLQVNSSAIIRPDVLEMLACPACRQKLTLEASQPALVCPQCKKAYPIRQGVTHFIHPAELTGMNRRFARLYDWFSWFYGLFSKIAFAYIGITEEQARQEILTRLEPQGGKVLEVSIGPGVNLPYLMSRTDVGEIYGLDISMGQLNRCQALLRRKGWSVELFLGNAEQLPFGDEGFDAVFHIGGINFFNNKKQAIEEMIRVARPGARIVIADETEKGARAYEWSLPGFKRSFKSQRQEVQPPIDLVPAGMHEVQVRDVWKGWFYSLEFRKPC